MVSFFEFFIEGSRHSAPASPAVGARKSFCFGLPASAPLLAFRPKKLSVNSKLSSQAALRAAMGRMHGDTQAS